MLHQTAGPETLQINSIGAYSCQRFQEIKLMTVILSRVGLAGQKNNIKPESYLKVSMEVTSMKRTHVEEYVRQGWC